MTRPAPLHREYERRQHLTMIESMLRDGRSEREIVSAVEEATGVRPGSRPGTLRHLRRWLRL